MVVQSLQFYCHSYCLLALLNIGQQSYLCCDLGNSTTILYYTILQCSQLYHSQYSSLVISAKEQQLQKFSTLNYSTIATVVQCSQLQYNSYHSLGAILQFLYRLFRLQMFLVSFKSIYPIETPTRQIFDQPLEINLFCTKNLNGLRSAPAAFQMYLL